MRFLKCRIWLDERRDAVAAGPLRLGPGSVHAASWQCDHCSAHVGVTGRLAGGLWLRSADDWRTVSAPKHRHAAWQHVRQHRQATASLDLSAVTAKVEAAAAAATTCRNFASVAHAAPSTHPDEDHSSQLWLQNRWWQLVSGAAVASSLKGALTACRVTELKFFSPLPLLKHSRQQRPFLQTDKADSAAALLLDFVNSPADAGCCVCFSVPRDVHMT